MYVNGIDYHIVEEIKNNGQILTKCGAICSHVSTIEKLPRRKKACSCCSDPKKAAKMKEIRAKFSV